MIRRTILTGVIALTICFLTSCGGGGGTNPSMALYGSIEGYVYAAIGSEPAERVADAAPTGYKPVTGASVNASAGGASKSTTTNSNGYYKISALPAGSCNVTISKTGYANKQYTVAVSANSTTTVGGTGGATLAPAAYGSLRVTANVAGAEVIIDGESTGFTISSSGQYKTFSYISAGSHTVGVEKSGYPTPAEQNVEVSAGATSNVTFVFGEPDLTPPVADAGDDGKTFVATYYTYQYQYGDVRDYTPHANSYILDGTGSYDSDGGSISYLWTQTGGPSVQLSSNSIAKPSFTPSTEGTYAFSLKVRDESGNWSNTDYISVYAAQPTGKIVYYTSDGIDAEIRTVNADGTSLAQLTYNSTTDRDPVWSPDGTKVFYACNPTGTMLNICSVNTDRTGYYKIPIDYAAPDDFSPDGTEISFTCLMNNYQEICKMNSDYTNIVQLTTMRLSNGTMFSRYSPDGQKIIFQAYFGGDNTDVYIMNSDGSGLTNLTNNNKATLDATWTPDGRILFNEAIALGYDYTLFKMNADGSGRQALTHPAGISDIQSPAMSADEEFIFFTSDDDYLHVMYADGSAEMSYGIYARKLDYHPGP